MSRQVQQGINIGDRHLFRTVRDFYDVVTCGNLALLQHPKIKSRSSVLDNQSWHAGFVHADAEAVTGHARLGYFEYCLTDAVSITNADLVVGQPFHGEILSELSQTKIIAPQNVFP